jgi:hypothetical protein
MTPPRRKAALDSVDVDGSVMMVPENLMVAS